MMPFKLVIIALLFLFPVQEIAAQVVLFNGGTVIHVEDSTVLCVQGDYKAADGVDAPGVIGLAGEMVIEGNWINSSSGTGFNDSDTGTVRLVGLDNPQTILGSTLTRFPNLHLARPGSGKEVLLQIDCEAFGTLNLDDDILNTRDFSFYLSNSDPDALLRSDGNTPPLSMDSDGGFIISFEGNFARMISPDFKLDEYLFPMASAARWQPITIAAEGDSSNIYKVRFVDEPPPGLISMDSQLSSINPDWYHLIERIGNDAAEKIRIFYDPLTSDICDPQEVGLTQYRGQRWEALENTFSYDGAGYLASTEVRNYPNQTLQPFSSPYFALAGRIQDDGSPSCAFPPELLQLVVSPQESSFLLQWEVEPKPNLTGYLIARSETGFNFIDMGWESASTQTVPLVSYEHTDSSVALNQRYFYRLEELDINGGSKFSNIVEVILLGDESILIGELFPNPSDGSSSIWMSTTEEMVLDITIFNALGQSVYNQSQHVLEGYQQFELGPPLIASGSYWVQIKYPGGHAIRKWMVD